MNRSMIALVLILIAVAAGVFYIVPKFVGQMNNNSEYDTFQEQCRAKDGVAIRNVSPKDITFHCVPGDILIEIPSNTNQK